LIRSSLHQPELRGEKVLLKPLAEEHLARSLEWVNDPCIMATVLRVLPVTWQDQRAWFANLQASETRMVWAIQDARTLDHVGNTGFYHIDRLHRRAEFWIYIGLASARGTVATRNAQNLFI